MEKSVWILKVNNGKEMALVCKAVFLLEIIFLASKLSMHMFNMSIIIMYSITLF